jgi:hypothetical protein
VRLARYIWASPNTLVGLMLVVLNGLTKGSVEIVDGVLEARGPFLAWLLRRCTLLPGGVAAITFGHVVLGRDREMLALCRTHEHAHVRQYEVWGPSFIPVYLMASLWAWVNGRGAYIGNAFERAAVQAELFTVSPPARRRTT